ncbi:MAG: hypothetical protein Q7R34_06255, partial [Dehalococcoidia bacterium]|nr:hypothetical protein [Dehalococcoidia bacterium]
MTAEIVNVSLAIVATILSVLAIGTTIAFFVIQTRQSREMEKDNAQFAQDMHATLAELKGISTSTQGTVQQHQDMLLRAVLEQKGASIKQETSPLLEGLSKRIEGVEQTVGVQNKQEIAQLKKELLQLKGK